MQSLLQTPKAAPWWSYAAVTAGALVIAVACAALLAGLLASVGGTQRRVVEVSLMRPPPPPPEPIVKPPEPPLVREEVKLPEPEVKPEPLQPKSEAPHSDRLGLDSAPGTGSDAFGLSARKGGRDITLGEGNGAERASAIWYAGVLQDRLNAHLNKNDQLRKTGYRAEVRIWIASSGAVERVELLRGTGDAKMDGVLQTALEATPPLRPPPPADVPQPIRIRITSRGAS